MTKGGSGLEQLGNEKNFCDNLSSLDESPWPPATCLMEAGTGTDEPWVAGTSAPGVGPVPASCFHGH